MIKKILFSLLIVLSFTSCRTVKVANGKKEFTSKVSLKKVENELLKRLIPNQKLESIYQLKYQSKKEFLTFILQSKHEKEVLFWANFSKFGITGVRSLLTPTSFKMYDKLNKKYAEGSYNYINKALSTSGLNFKIVEAIFLGLPFYPMAKETHSIKRISSSQIQIKTTQDKRTIQYIVNPDFRIQELLILDPIKQIKICIRYKEYTKIKSKENNQFIPSKINVVVNSPKENNTVDLQLKNIKEVSEMRTPYKVPSSYENIR